MTQAHYSWHLIPSVSYKRICRVLWGFFLCVAYTYATHGYIFASIFIMLMATTGYFTISSYQEISKIHFHAGIWQVGDEKLINLQVIRAMPYLLIISGEKLNTKQKKRFVLFREQLSKQKEHEFCWVMKLMFTHQSDVQM